MVPSAPAPPGSRFLGHLPARLRKRILGACTPVDLKLGAVLTRPGDRLEDVYFPCDAFISQVVTLEGREVEVGMVGSEGMYGIQAGMGTEQSPVIAVVQGAGSALRMSIGDFRARLARNPELRELLARYTFFVYSQVIQSAACNRFHLMEQRLARWLLLTADRAHGPGFAITHRFLAAMLGVRRAGVSEATAELESLDLVRHSRGRITIVDRRGLEKLACACYRADRHMYDRIVSTQLDIH